MHQIGGGWCYTEEDCLNRSKTELGSSKYWPTVVPLGGLFSDNKTVNGEFYNWNVVALIYCDGGSFSGFRCDTYDNGVWDIYRLDDGSEVYTGNQKPEGRMSASRAQRGRYTARGFLISRIHRGNPSSNLFLYHVWPKKAGLWFLIYTCYFTWFT